MFFGPCTRTRCGHLAHESRLYGIQRDLSFLLSLAAQTLNQSVISLCSHPRERPYSWPHRHLRVITNFLPYNRRGKKLGNLQSDDSKKDRVASPFMTQGCIIKDFLPLQTVAALKSKKKHHMPRKERLSACAFWCSCKSLTF